MLNPLYAEHLAEMHAQFTEHGFIQLDAVFEREAYEKLLAALRKAHFRREHKLTMHRYAVAALPSRVRSFFTGPEMLSVLSTIVGKQVFGVEAQVFNMGWKDYTIRHDEAIEQPGIDIIYDCTTSWDPDLAGGAVVYVDEDGNANKVAAGKNVLTIVRREKQLQSYLQYCNHYAEGSKRLFMLGTLTTEE